MMKFFGQLKKIFKRSNCIDNTITYKNSFSKYSMTAECTMELSGRANEKSKEINEYLKQIVKKYIENPEKLIQYIKVKGANVYRIKNASKILALIGEEEGFIVPLKGINALILNIIISLLSEQKFKISFKTEEMFVFDTQNTEIYTVARAIHKFFGFKNNLPGYDSNSQKIFKKIYGRRKSKHAQAQMDNLSLKDIFACRDALARDLESINFTIQLAIEYEKSKKALAKIKSKEKTKI